MRILALNKETKNDLLENLLKRSPGHYGEFEGRVNEIVHAVREKKDAALYAYTEKFDGAKIDADSILVTEEEIEEAYGLVEERLLNVIRKSLINIRKYHEKQLQNS